MGQLIIKRERAFGGFASDMHCYVNNNLVCRLKEKQEFNYYIDNGIIEFKCHLTNGKVSEIVYIDMYDRESVRLSLTLGVIGSKPKITVLDKSAIFDPSIYVNKLEYKPEKFSPTRTVGNYFAVDEKTQRWCVGKGIIPSLKNSMIYHFSDILNFELLEDGTSVTKGGVGSAVVGGLLFGAPGAIVGGIAGTKNTKHKCTSLSIKITLQNTNNIIEYIKLITTPTDKNSSLYKIAYKNAQEILSLLQIIVAQNNTLNNTVLSNPYINTNSRNNNCYNQNNTYGSTVADDIRKYKALLDEGLITEAEFIEKKRQLLGL